MFFTFADTRQSYAHKYCTKTAPKNVIKKNFHSKQISELPPGSFYKVS